MLVIIILFLILFIYKIYNLKKEKNILPNNNIYDITKNYNDFNDFIYLTIKYIRYNKIDLFNKIDYNIYYIQKYIPPSNLIPIKNKYILEKNENDFSDYHFVIYYLSDNKCHIIIRRLDDIHGWDIPFKIIIDNEEIIEIKSNVENYLIFDFYTKIKLYKTELDKNQLISKIIIQTGESNKSNNIIQHNAILSFIELNPEYEYMYFNSHDRGIFIKNNFDISVYNAYNKIIPGAYQADLFRYCILYYYGGCYFDNKQINRIPLREVIEPTKELMLCKDILNNHSYYNAIILAKKNNIIMKKCIDECVKNIENNYYGTCHLCPTGPCLLYKCADGYKYDFIFNFKSYYYLSYLRHKGGIIYKNKLICNISFYNYYTDIKKNYFSLWIKKGIYKN